MTPLVHDTSGWPGPGSGDLIVCDWNGTLVDDVDRALSVTNSVLRTFKRRPLRANEFCHTFRLPLVDFFLILGVDRAVTEMAVAAWNRGMEARPAMRLGRGARALLDGAFNAMIPVGVITAADAEIVKRDAHALSVDTRLAFVEGAVASKAASLAPYVRNTPGHVIYVGDTEYDVREATRAGAVPVGFGGGYRPATALLEAGATTVIDDLSTALEIVAVRS